MSEAPQYARYAIIEHVVHLVNRDYEAMCRDYYTLEVRPFVGSATLFLGLLPAPSYPAQYLYPSSLTFWPPFFAVQFMDRSVDTRPVAPYLAAFFDDVLDQVRVFIFVGWLAFRCKISTSHPALIVGI